MEKSMDRKLAEIRSNPDSKAFILADAKDADMGFGIAAPGAASPEAHRMGRRFKTLEEYRQQIREIVAQGAVDIVLMSASVSEQLAIKERIFENSHVTPAARANDATDVHVIKGSSYLQEPARPFRTATIDHIQCGKMECAPEERGVGANLGLYSVTFNNNLERDLETLERFKEFRLECEARSFNYFLEVFDPNAPENLDPEGLPRFINDHIARSLAGVTERGRPLFLKIVYHGPKAMEELVRYDPNLVVGILGGSSGTTYDAFKLLGEAQKYGAKVALFGRKINNSEHQLAFIRFLRMIVEGEITPEDAVRAYHGVLEAAGIEPIRSFDDDMVLTSPAVGLGAGVVVTVPEQLAKPAATYAPTPSPVTAPPAQAGAPSAAPAPPLPHPAPPSAPASRMGEPDFDKMTPAEKLAWNQRRRDRVFD